MSIDKAKTAAEIVKIASDIYDAFSQRKARKEADEKARRIKELEDELRQIKEKK